MMIRLVHDVTRGPDLISDVQVEVEALPRIGDMILINGHQRYVTRVAHTFHVVKNGDAAHLSTVVSTKDEEVSILG